MKFTKLLTFCCMLMFWANPMFAEIRTAQKQLNRMGYQAGLADGVWGNKTENAVKRFLSDNNQKWDGTFDHNEIKLIEKIFLTNGFKNTRKNEVFLLPQDVYESFQKLLEELPQLERFFRIILERYLGALQQKIIFNQVLDAQERYVDFQNRYPLISARFPNYLIASYLNMSAEFLSRIRNS